MGHDLAKAGAVNAALAHQVNCAAHDAVSCRLLLAGTSRLRCLSSVGHEEQFTWVR